jgi:hypothetical protein
MMKKGAVRRWWMLPRNKAARWNRQVIVAQIIRSEVTLFR